MLGEFLGSGASITKLLLHLNGNSNDSSGNGNNGTDTSITYSLANGKFGQGAGFNGSSSRINLPTSLVQTGNFTISLWVKFVDATNNILFSAVDFAVNYGWVVFETNGSDKFVMTVFSNGAATSQSVVSNETLVEGRWYNLIGVRDGTNIKLYINGSYDNQSAWSTAQNSTVQSTNLGYGKNGGGGINYMDGQIDEVIVENVAWSAEKVKKYFTNSKGRFGII